MQSSHRNLVDPSGCRSELYMCVWPESNVTLGYLGTLNTWGKRFSFFLIASEILVEFVWPLSWKQAS